MKTIIALYFHRIAHETRSFKWGGIAVGALAVAIIVYRSSVDPKSLARRALDRYLAYLSRRFDSLMLRADPRRIVVLQAIAALLVVWLAVAEDDKNWLFLFVPAALAPWAVLERRHRKRVLAIEAQTDGFVIALANALKATPSIGDAFISLKQVLSEPLKSEIDLAVKHMRLGSTLEEALVAMARRIESRMFDTALASVLIGQRVGGHLPKILETSGAALRELQRLEAFVRAKTASGRIQMLVVGLAPAAFVLFFERMQPGFFDPLTATRGGMIALGIAILSWIVAVVLGRKILRVDI